LKDFAKNIQKLNFMKIRPVVAQLFHVDGERDIMKLTVAFQNFANAPTRQYRSIHVPSNVTGMAND
jgi:hypothetical protein